MMRKRKYFQMVVCLFWILEALLLAGCRPEDKALVFVPRSAAETDCTTETGSEVKADGEGKTGSGATTDDDGTEVMGTAGTEQVSAENVIYIHVCGAVVSPGVVKLPGGSRAEAALEAAGGFAEAAQTDYVNLASKLEDGQQLYFPSVEEAEALRQEEKEAERAGQLLQNGMVNINTAGAGVLCTLPGIGEARAQAIIDYRERYGGFESIEDIMQVPGIKESAFSKFCDRIVVN